MRFMRPTASYFIVHNGTCLLKFNHRFKAKIKIGMSPSPLDNENAEIKT